jgi:hypothetical protein
VCWPEELLPKEEAFSHVRILTFGYDANVVSPVGHASLNSLFEHSVNLLSALSRERRQNAVSYYITCRHQRNMKGFQRDRPIIFVAHCLGGLLVKDVSRLDLSLAPNSHLTVSSVLGSQPISRCQGNQTSSCPGSFCHTRDHLPWYSSQRECHDFISKLDSECRTSCFARCKQKFGLGP